MKIPLLARYNGTVEKSYLFVMNNVKYFPLNPFEIIKKFKWGLLTYEDMAKKLNCSIDDICECFGSDGYSIYDGKYYSIAYNISGNSKERINFTLAHEIGHIILNHHKDFEVTEIIKDNFIESEYKILENEANCFARNILAPAPLSQKVPFLFRTLKLNDIFNISSTARSTRLNFLKNDLNYLTATEIFKMQQNFDTYLICRNCNAQFINNTYHYCPQCGTKKLKKGIGLMIYKNEVELDELKKAKICPKCGNEEILEGPYCKICGLELFNRCTNSDNAWDSCGEVCDANARYCHKCGAKTLFYHLGIIPNYTYENTQIEELPF